MAVVAAGAERRAGIFYSRRSGRRKPRASVDQRRYSGDVKGRIFAAGTSGCRGRGPSADRPATSAAADMGRMTLVIERSRDLAASDQNPFMPQRRAELKAPHANAHDNPRNCRHRKRTSLCFANVTCLPASPRAGFGAVPHPPADGGHPGPRRIMRPTIQVRRVVTGTSPGIVTLPSGL